MLSITGPTSVTVGQTAQYTATATYSDGSSQPLTTGPVWSLSSSVATITQAGVLSALAAGTVTVRADYGGQSAQLPVSLVAATSQDWIFCADEGAFCTFTGANEVRYGANGIYTYKTLSDGSACTNSVFGDPLIGVPKQCAIRQQDWTVCAEEGAVCAFAGAKEVRYGANDIYTSKTLSDGTACTSSVFGDPLIGVLKHCDIRSTSTSDPPSLTGLSISGPTSVKVGQTAQYTATATYSDGSSQPLTTGVWWYTDESTVTIDHATGVLTAVAAGPATVRFHYGAITDPTPYPISVVHSKVWP
jgi:hypothetical protein